MCGSFFEKRLRNSLKKIVLVLINSYSEEKIIPSLGRGAVESEVAGRGLYVSLSEYAWRGTPPYTLPGEGIAQSLALNFFEYR
jgi:hypothetical protein